MRRPPGIPPDIAMAVSLLLCIATTLLWVRNRSVSDNLSLIDRPTVSIRLTSGRDGPRFIAIRRHSFAGNPYRGRDTWQIWTRPRRAGWPADQRFGRSWRGFGYERRTKRIFWTGGEPPITGYFTMERYVLLAPWWPFLLLPALLPFLAAARRLRGRFRTRAGRCRRCGYDLRATPDRCPECGSVNAENLRASGGIHVHAKAP
jgi:hypothetical protein